MFPTGLQWSNRSLRDVGRDWEPDLSRPPPVFVRGGGATEPLDKVVEEGQGHGGSGDTQPMRPLIALSPGAVPGHSVGPHHPGTLEAEDRFGPELGD